MQFNDTANLVQPFTSNLEEIQNRLHFHPVQGQTALLDAIYLGMHEMKKAKNPRKALLIISDGGDNNSRYTESEIQEPGEGSRRPVLCHRYLRTYESRAPARRKKATGRRC